MKVNFDRFEDYTDYIKDNHVEICWTITRSIEKAVRGNKDEALLFEIYFAGQDFVYEITIDKPDWVDSLTRSIQVFTDNNESDKAIEAYEIQGLVIEVLELEKSF